MVEGNHHLVIIQEDSIDESINQHLPMGFLPHVQLAEGAETAAGCAAREIPRHEAGQPVPPSETGISVSDKTF